MKAWERARRVRRCGFCGQTIAVGQPLLARWLAGYEWRKVRCAACAGEPVPADLPEPEIEPARRLRATPIQPLLAVASLARDWKTAAAEREPGEDD